MAPRWTLLLFVIHFVGGITQQECCFQEQMAPDPEQLNSQRTCCGAQRDAMFDSKGRTEISNGLLQVGATGLSHTENMSTSSARLEGDSLGAHARVRTQVAGCLLPTCVVSLVLLSFFWRHLKTDANVHQEGEVAGAIVTTECCYCQLVFYCGSTLVIPDSWALANQLGGTAAESGLLVSTYYVGILPTMVFGYVAFKIWPDAWRRAARIFKIAGALNVLSNLLYTGLVAQAQNSQESSHRPMLVSIILTRMVGGLGGGAYIACSRTQICRLSAPEQRLHRQERYVFAGMLGLGLGPILASGTHCFCAALEVGSIGPVAVGAVGIGMAICQLVSTLWVPCLDSCEDRLLSEYSSEFSFTEFKRRRAVVLLCLVFAIFRATCISGVEIATVFILESQHGWSRKHTGIAVGVAFLTAIPVRYSYTLYEHRHAACQCIRYLLIVTIAGSILLFQAGRLLPTGMKAIAPSIESRTILIGDSLIFSSFILCDGLSQGILTQHLLPETKSILSVNNVNLIMVLLKDGLGAFGAPPLVRYIIAVGGQNLYAALQLGIVLAAAALAWCGFLPLVEASPRDSVSTGQK